MDNSHDFQYSFVRRETHLAYYNVITYKLATHMEGHNCTPYCCGAQISKQPAMREDNTLTIILYSNSNF